MHQIKIFYIFVPNLKEIYLSGKKHFLSKTKANLASWQPKNWFNGQKQHFWW